MKKKTMLQCVFMLVLAMCWRIIPASAFDLIIFEENFEGTTQNWFAENGVWEIGVPTSGPGAAHGGMQCAGTILGGYYPPNTDSRLFGPFYAPWDQGVTLPEVEGSEEIHLRFWNWFSYPDDYGQVQISVKDETTNTWIETWTVEGNSVSSSSGGWSLKDVELTAYAGQTIRIAFRHVADGADQSYGWYIDDIQIIKKVPFFTGDFEDGWVDWSASNGVWQIGEPTSGPGTCYEGVQCAGTVLGGSYPANTDSRLVSATITLGEISENEEIHLRFWNWFSYPDDSGQVQVSIFDGTTKTWSAWENVGNSVSSSSGGWSIKDVDLTEYAGQTVRIGFFHVADGADQSYGWYVDDIQIIQKPPVFTGDFEMGWVDWSASNGVWQIGEPTSGPGSCYEGVQCAGTVLGGSYPANTDSRLVSATITLGEISENEEIHLRFWNWFSYPDDSGQVQVSTFDEATETWSSWENVGNPVSISSGGWSIKDVELTAYGGQTIRIAFFHLVDGADQGSGWFVDDIQIIKKAPVFTSDFEMGWVDWSASNGVWQIGEPTSGPGACYEGEQCAGTVLTGSYPANTDSRLVSATIDLTGCSPAIVYLQFREWFSYNDDHGEVQISTWDAELDQWSAWSTLATSSAVSPVWTLKYSDLTSYVGKKFRIGFWHVVDGADQSHGWFIDNVEIIGPTQIMPTINSVSFISYIPDPCTSCIDIFATDPCGGDLIYSWQLPDGGTLLGAGASMEFIPPEIRVAPYKVLVAVSSDTTNISSFTRTLKIFTEVLYDSDGDDDIDGADLIEFAIN
ncbi:MAG: choice-of-anchor J domain-containing protein [Proteobacteria bacterium]|nr:choice-of-anchor J domain-containing protein [Pseudomonadota bacterium]